MTDPFLTSDLSLDDLEHHVVAATLSDSDVLEYVNVRFKNRLSNPRLRSLFQAAQTYYDITRGPLTREALSTILVNNEPDLAKHQDYLSLYDALVSPPYIDTDAPTKRWYLHQYDVQWRVNQTGEILAKAAEAMKVGHSSHGKLLTGSEAAWQVLSESRLEFESVTSGGNLHEAEITATTDQAKQDYAWATEHKHIGVPMAINEVNDHLAGLRAGDLYLVTAFASEGKSFMMLNDGHAAWKAGKNVAIATGEMSVRKYRNRFIALHSCESALFKAPLETRKIDRGILTTEEHEIYLQVLDDIRTNPRYGKMFIFQFPYRATPSLIFNKFVGYDQIVPIDMAIIDYLGLMTSERMRASRREELDDLIRETKSLALDFAKGRGLAVAAGYQVNRTSFENARREGYYTLTCFSESSEAEKSADAAMWLLSLPQNPEELKAAFIKNRDDDLGEPFFLRRNLKHAQLTSLQSTRGRTAGPGFDLLEI